MQERNSAENGMKKIFKKVKGRLHKLRLDVMGRQWGEI